MNAENGMLTEPKLGLRKQNNQRNKDTQLIVLIFLILIASFHLS